MTKPKTIYKAWAIMNKKTGEIYPTIRWEKTWHLKTLEKVAKSNKVEIKVVPIQIKLLTKNK